MSIFRRSRPNDVLFLMPVRFADEKLSRGKTRMLYCDAAGKVYASIMSQSVYEFARDNAERMKQSHKSFATVGLETSPGNFIPASVEIDTEEVWALEHILGHALKNDRLPDILKKYLKPIITRGEASREAAMMEDKRSRRRVHREVKPKVLNRLPYYREHDLEFSAPIYKAEYGYPLIVLKMLPATKPTQQNHRRLLILDSDGDLAVVTVPYQLINKSEIEIKQQNKEKNNICMIITKHSEGLAMEYMSISQTQRKALDTITRYFEETGYGRRSISATARTVLDRAKNRVSPMAR